MQVHTYEPSLENLKIYNTLPVTVNVSTFIVKSQLFKTMRITSLLYLMCIIHMFMLKVHAILSAELVPACTKHMYVMYIYLYYCHISLVTGHAVTVSHKTGHRKACVFDATCNSYRLQVLFS